MKIYKTLDENGFFREQTKLEKGCWINLINPTVQEINTLCTAVGVREEFIKCSGTQFDPRFAEIMVKMIDEDTEYVMRER